MSTLAQTVLSPIQSDRSVGSTVRDGRPPAGPSRRRRSSALDFSHRVLLELVTADDVRAGMQRVVSTLRREGGAACVEWWAPSAGGSAMQLEAAAGSKPGRARRTAVRVGPAGVLVVSGERWTPQLVAALNRLAPVLRRRWSEEQLADQVVRLARRNEALEDFASLVAHELKAPLHAALLHEDASVGVERALELVDALLEAARAEAASEPWSSPSDSLVGALRDVGTTDVEVVADLPDRFPLPSAWLRLVLRNLIKNAVAAGARHVHVSAVGGRGTQTLLVDDDGVGVGASDRYASGSGVGLSLVRRIAGRYGGTIELTARPLGGTRASLAVPES